MLFYFHFFFTSRSNDFPLTEWKFKFAETECVIRGFRWCVHLFENKDESIEICFLHSIDGATYTTYIYNITRKWIIDRFYEHLNGIKLQVWHYSRSNDEIQWPLGGFRLSSRTTFDQNANKPLPIKLPKTRHNNGILDARIGIWSLSEQYLIYKINTAPNVIPTAPTNWKKRVTRRKKNQQKERRIV